MIIYNGYQIKPHKESPTLYIVVTDGKGGKVPDILTGMYTTPTIAKQAIDKYLDNKPKKGKEDAETRSESGS